MKTKLTGADWEYGFIGLVLRLLLAMPAWANPIEMPEKSVVVENTFLRVCFKNQKLAGFLGNLIELADQKRMKLQ